MYWESFGFGRRGAPGAGSRHHAHCSSALILLKPPAPTYYAPSDHRTPPLRRATPTDGRVATETETDLEETIADDRPATPSLDPLGPAIRRNPRPARTSGTLRRGGPPEPRLGREVRPPSGGRFLLEEAFCRGTDASAPSIPVVSRPGPPRKRRTEDAERARSLRVDGPPKPRRARDPLGRGTIRPGPASSVPSLPARRGRYGFVRAAKALPLVEDTRAEPRGGGRPPSNRTSRSIYVVRGRNPGPNIPFFSRRDGPRHRTNDEPASSRGSTFLRVARGKAGPRPSNE